MALLPEANSYGPVRPDEAGALADLFGRARLAADQKLLPGYIEAALAEGYFYKAVTRFLDVGYGADALMLVARAPDQKILGFCMVGPADPYTEALGDFAQRAPTCELNWLYRDPDAETRGVASRLFQLAAEESVKRGYQQIVVNLLQGKPGLEAYYQRAGLRPLARIVEHNTRNGQVFEVPCWLYGAEDLQNCCEALARMTQKSPVQTQAPQQKLG